VLALGVRAHVALHGFFRRLGVDAGRLIVGVAHAGRGERGQPGIEISPQLRRRQQLSDAHAIGALTTPDEATLAGVVGVVELPVGVDQQCIPVGDFLQLVRSQRRRLLSEKLLRLHCCLDRRLLWQITEELLDHRRC
jgi:hypothetical protein